MVENVVALYQEILDASYNVYGDVNRISSSMERVGSILGMQKSERVSIASAAMPQELPSPIPVEVKKPEAPILPPVKKEIKATPRPHGIGRQIEFPVEIQNVPQVIGERPKPTVTRSPLSLKSIQKTAIPTEELKENLPAVMTKETKPDLTATEARVKEMAKTTFVSPALQKVEKPMIEIPVGSVVGATSTSLSNPVSDLLNLVRTRGQLTVSDAADSLHVDKDLIEKWARILNQSSLLKLKYQLVGDIVLEA